MLDAVDVLNDAARRPVCATPESLMKAAEEIKQLRARVAELESGGEAVGVIKTYTGKGSSVPFAPFNQVYWTDGRMPKVGTKLYTAPQRDELLKAAEALQERGWFNPHACADKETSEDMNRMCEAIARVKGGAVWY